MLNKKKKVISCSSVNKVTDICFVLSVWILCVVNAVDDARMIEYVTQFNDFKTY